LCFNLLKHNVYGLPLREKQEVTDVDVSVQRKLKKIHIEVNVLNISKEQILKKMEIELESAKQSNDPRTVHDHLVAIRTLCDLLLETSSLPETVPQIVRQPSPSVLMPQSSRTLWDEDDANGESIFDF
jgi:hypothetical protein